MQETERIQTMVSRKIFLALGFFAFTPLFILFTLIYYGNYTGNSNQSVMQTQTESVKNEEVLVTEQNNLSTVLGAYTFTDAIPLVISKYLDKYGSTIPAEAVTRYANEYGIDPRLIIAIAQQESNLGKKMPERCHNAWGYGIHARGTLCFDSWDEGIKTVTKGIAEKYCQKGLCDDPCVMMKKYTPSSNGSWCYGVNQFLDEMRSGNF